MEYDEYLKLMIFIPVKIEKCTTLLSNEYLDGSALKFYHIPYLYQIHSSDGISQKQLNEVIPFDKSRISIVVRELIDNGLVTDTGTKRNSSLHLTDKGVNILPLCKMFIELVKKEIFGENDIFDPEYIKKTFEFDEKLDRLIEKYSKK